MPAFITLSLPEEPTETAPDGFDVRVLLRLTRGSMAHFQLAPGRTSAAVEHRTVEELWYLVGGEGEIWRERGGVEQIVALKPGVSLSIPVGTRFQFRSLGPEPLTAIGVTMPAWPGPEEAVFVTGPWQAS